MHWLSVLLVQSVELIPQLRNVTNKIRGFRQLFILFLFNNLTYLHSKHYREHLINKNI